MKAGYQGLTISRASGSLTQRMIIRTGVLNHVETSYIRAGQAVIAKPPCVCLAATPAQWNFAQSV
jgi:hypothetical protein